MKIRKAVGAVVFQNNEYLLIHKVKNSDCNEDISGHWDFPKGGVIDQDSDLESSVLRELKEETGSTNYRIVYKFDPKICFSFPAGYKYDSQETVMFYVEYLGNREDLTPQDEEIDKVEFYSKEYLLRLISQQETYAFLKQVYNEI
ncbi:putative (di)nucleoside polyphosphate hydrolase [Natranaerovirga pectinivora]|uniref:Putative (Di)nucleoside polyphosphate hydrolase n=1 Tax=Natranaerovirga pectinivora TaxID=682400 RepID=A0A4R3MQS1_9FIRM|nr:NUDIX hydrolase [Natranaerovirga pectinivora]TCT17134.1 putative (di)nucleoside polyphosphate hydrolase [Natranaerovirga pectinivora]